MKTIPVRCETVDQSTGKTIKAETARFGVLPPRAGVCAICAHDHKPEEPHNAQSLYYGVIFQAEQERAPTWADAVAHCAEPVQAAWKAELIRMKAWTAPPEGVAVIAQPYVRQGG